MKLVLIVLLSVVAACANAQRVGIGTTTPHSSAKLDISATDAGILIPRLTTAQRNAISPVAAGLLVFDSDTKSFWFYTGTAWNNLSATTNTWNTGGNPGTDSVSNYIGTTDEMPLIFRVRNLRSGKIDSASAGTSFGYRAMSGSITGSSNSAFGFKSLLANTSGRYNTGVGALAMSNNTSGEANTSVGFLSLSMNNGNFNTGIGYYSLRTNATGEFNTALGIQSLYSNVSGSYNTAVGVNALFSNTNHNNTAVGHNSLFSCTGPNNTAIGHTSLFGTTTGQSNTAVGVQALYSNQTGGYNTAVGVNSLFTNTGSYNTAVGENALFSNTGSNSVAVGASALAANTTGQSNTAIGVLALSSKTTGNGNVAVGNAALAFLTSGFNNIAIGNSSGTNEAAWNNTISIGNAGTANAFHNQTFIGNSSTGWIGGYVGWSIFSDRRLKTNITEEIIGLDFITRLRPVLYSKNIKEIALITGNKETPDFENKYEVESIRYSGFIAQEVEDAAKQSNYNFSGVKKINGPDGFYTLSYESFVVPLVKAVQEQQKEIEELRKQLEKLQGERSSAPLRTQ